MAEQKPTGLFGSKTMAPESKEAPKTGSLFGPQKPEEKKSTVVSTAPVSGFGGTAFQKP